MDSRYVSLNANKVNASEVIFISKFNEKLGSVAVINGKLVFTLFEDGSQIILGDSKIDIEGSNHGDYIYWNTNESEAAWRADGDKVHIGTNAGKNNQGDNAIAIGALAGQNNQPDNSIVINASGLELNGAKTSSLYVSPVAYETRTGITGSFESEIGVSSSQSTNVMSYNPQTKEITYRELGLYNDTTNIPNIGSEDNQRIISNHSIIPKNDGLENTYGISLGNPTAYWKGLYASEIHMSGETLYVTDPNTGEQMSISFNPINLTTTISNQNTTIQSVNTSTVIPGQIDANLLPFTGFSYIGNFNPETYVQNMGTNNFDFQTLRMVYDLNFSILSSQRDFEYIPTQKTSAIFSKLSGGYYLVQGITNPDGIDVSFSKMVADTNLTEFDRAAIGDITSTFRASDPKVLNLKNNDMLILAAGLQYSDTGIEMVMYWSQIEFKLPVNGVTTINLTDLSVTNPKIASKAVSTRNIQAAAVTFTELAFNAVTEPHIQNNSVSTDKVVNSSITSSKIAPEAVTFTKLSPEIQRLLTGVTDPVSIEALNALTGEINSTNTRLEQTITELRESNKKWEQRVLAMEEFINTMMSTYSIVKPDNGFYSYNGKNQNLNINSFDMTLTRNENVITIILNDYTYNVFTGEMYIADKNNNFIAKLSRNSFVNKKAIVSIALLSESMFPLEFSIQDLSSNKILIKNLNF